MYCVVEVRRRRRRWRRRLGLGPQVLGLLPPHDLVASWCQLPQPRGPRPQVLAHRNASTLLPSTPACPPPLPSRILSCPLRHRLLTAPPWPAGAWSAPAARSCCLLVPPLFPPSRLPAGQAPGFVAAPPSLVAAPAHSAAGAQALGFVAALPSLVAAAIPPNPASFSLYEAVLLEKLLIALGLLP